MFARLLNGRNIHLPHQGRLANSINFTLDLALSTGYTPRTIEARALTSATVLLRESKAPKQLPLSLFHTFPADRRVSMGENSAETPFPLTDVDKWVLSLADEDFTSHNWADMRRIIGQYRQ
jgi:hypothetical protein